MSQKPSSTAPSTANSGECEAVNKGTKKAAENLKEYLSDLNTRLPRLILGTWYNADEDITYLDVAVVFPQRQEAVLLAITYNQIALYDLAGETEVSLDGTGEERSDMPPENQRLPPLRRM